MGRRVQKFFVHVALSAVAAIVTPAMAAGLIAGASAGTQALSGAIYPSDDVSGPEAGADPSAATVMHGPRKLSVLAGND